MSETIRKQAPCECDTVIDLLSHGLLKKLERQARNTNNPTVTQLLELLESICTTLRLFCALGKPASFVIVEHTKGMLDVEQVVVNS